MRRVALTLALAACGGSNAPPAGRSGAPASLIATPTATDDLQVATVNGRPIWGSCVSAQAARGATKPDALAQCIDFELLAQAAEAGGFTRDSEVVDATRTALVSQLVARDYEAAHTQPKDFDGQWDRIVGTNRLRFDHGEYRGSMYARINLAKTATAVQIAEARSVTEDIARALAPEHGLTPPDFRELVERTNAGRATLEIKLVKQYPRGGLTDPAYETALWQLREVGDVSQAIRTDAGYDVILFAENIPALHPTSDELIRELLPGVQRTFFATWTKQIITQLGVTIEKYETNFPLLESI